MLKQRVLTALIALAALLMVMFLIPVNAAKAIIGLLVIGGAWVWSAFLSGPEAAERPAFVALIALLVVLTGLSLPAAAPAILLVSLGHCAGCAAYSCCCRCSWRS